MIRTTVEADVPAAHVLVIEDNPVDAYFVNAALGADSSTQFVTTVVATLADARSALAGNPACVVLDLGLPDSDGLATLDLVRAVAPDVAIVVVTGLESPGLGLAAVARGAQDYLVKDAIEATTLTRAISFAIHRRSIENQLQASGRIHVARLNRRLKTLSAAGALLVSSADKASFTARMCDLLVEAGEYDGAYIAVRDGDGKAAEIIAARVPEHREPGAVPSSAEHPALLVLDGSRYAEGRDLPIAPSVMSGGRGELMSPVRRVAAFGFMSPQYNGALVICSDDERALTASELEMLERIASGVGYGLTSIRQRDQLRDHARQLQGSLEQLARTLATVVEFRDPYTAGHHREVAVLAGAIARHLGLDGECVRGIEVAAGIHDVGKICIPAEILAKPGSLTAAEFDLIKQHPTVGSDMVDGIDFPWPVQQMIRQHHERLDGSGYPLGLVGDEILLGSRIIAVADTINAYSARRPYRGGRGVDEALAHVLGARGHLFDADVVDAAEAVLATIPQLG